MHGRLTVTKFATAGNLDENCKSNLMLLANNFYLPVILMEKILIEIILEAKQSHKKFVQRSFALTAPEKHENINFEI